MATMPNGRQQNMVEMTAMAMWFLGHGGNHSMGSGTPNQSMPCPPSNLVWAIVSTILCCLPTGIVAIVYACKVDNLYLMGDYQGAVEASNKARNWATADLVARA